MAIILVVDDDPITRNAYKTRLTGLGHVVHEAENGSVGVTRAKEVQPNLVIMGVMMPIMNGLDALKLMKADEEIKKIPVVIVTGAQLDEEKHCHTLKLAHSHHNKFEYTPDKIVAMALESIKK